MQQGSKLFRDNLGLIVVDVPDTTKNRNWMKAYKARWKQRLDQLEIWMVSSPCVRERIRTTLDAIGTVLGFVFFSC